MDSFVYPDSINPQLAPAYDFVSTVPYLFDQKLALNFLGSKAFESVNWDAIERFAGKIRLQVKIMQDAARETVDRFADHWRSRQELLLPAHTEKAIAFHLKSLPLWKTIS